MNKWNTYNYSQMSPCKDCTSRQNGCHGTCEEYKNFREELDTIKEKRIQTIKKEKDYTDYRIKEIDKGRRKNR